VKETEKPLTTHDIALLAFWVSLTNQGAIFSLPKNVYEEHIKPNSEVVMASVYQMVKRLVGEADMNRLRDLVNTVLSTQEEIIAKGKATDN